MADRKVHLAVRQSGIHGFGVFALEPVKKGKFIAELQGSRIYYESSIHGQSNRYGDWIGVGKDKWIDPVDEFQYLNHSCNPNAGLKGAHTLRLYALRDITEGEEITIDYSTTESDPDYCFENFEPAHEHYRQFVGPVQSLPIETYKRYYPFIPTHFKRVYEKEVLSKVQPNETQHA